MNEQYKGLQKKYRELAKEQNIKVQFSREKTSIVASCKSDLGENLKVASYVKTTKEGQPQIELDFPHHQLAEKDAKILLLFVIDFWKEYAKEIKSQAVSFLVSSYHKDFFENTNVQFPEDVFDDVKEAQKILNFLCEQSYYSHGNIRPFYEIKEGFVQETFEKRKLIVSFFDSLQKENSSLEFRLSDSGNNLTIIYLGHEKTLSFALRNGIHMILEGETEVVNLEEKEELVLEKIEAWKTTFFKSKRLENVVSPNQYYFTSYMEKRIGKLSVLIQGMHTALEKHHNNTVIESHYADLKKNETEKNSSWLWHNEVLLKSYSYYVCFMIDRYYVFETNLRNELNVLRFESYTEKEPIQDTLQKWMKERISFYNFSF